jgi:hypothetical protein
MSRIKDNERRLITSPDELPDFAEMSADEEASWWETHDFTDGVFEGGPDVDAEIYLALGIPDPKRQFLTSSGARQGSRPFTTWRVARSASTGRFVRKSYASKNPTNTVVKTVKRYKKK